MFTQEIECDTCRIARELVEEVGDFSGGFAQLDMIS